MAGTKRIGVMAASEPALQARLLAALEAQAGVSAAVVRVDGPNEGLISQYDAIVDRVSPWVPCYRSYLRAAAMAGVDVVADPFHPAVDDAFFALSAARRLGFRTARTVLLPQHDYAVPDDRVLAHLQHPLSWQKIFAWVGAPATLRPARPRPSWEARVDDLPSLWAAFDQTGAQVVMLQERPPSETRLRALCIGDWATVSVDGPAVSEATMTGAAAIGQQLRRALGLCVNEAVFGVGHDGALLLLDPARPYPDLSPETLGEAWDGAVEALAEAVVDVSRAPRRLRDGYRFATG